MSISSLGGLILDSAVNKFNGIAVFQPVFNGVGGNLVAVQASRISTFLHTNVSHFFGVFMGHFREVHCFCGMICYLIWVSFEVVEFEIKIRVGPNRYFSSYTTF